MGGASSGKPYLPSCPHTGLRAYVITGDEEKGGDFSGIHRHKRLSLRAILRGSDGKDVPVEALVDTGSEVNLVRRGLIANECFQQSRPDLRLVGINQVSLGGGHREVRCKIWLDGIDIESKASTMISLPLVAFDAEIDVDLVLSYEWLVARDIEVKPRRHGIRVNLKNKAV